ncbi:hypothetical protein [Maritimibacter sp. DP1N21-5]|uniref:hypothetical protein n=1 Tax=Maritimibacter sp. DP1N21-5 TaxID=2836867 RepID=UPI001C45D05F|nr:hypothetical protein [Maritimibacter sp. DP1N21-5]MBV7409078.1 hypothetical protein [Maritimibacter sp. DP1N21-5]
MTASIHYLRPYHEARLDDIPLIWKQPNAETGESPTGITIHIPDFGQRREDTVQLLELIAGTGRVAVSLDLHRHGARRDRDFPELVDAVREDYARVLWTLLGETILDLPTIATWARHRFGHLPLTIEGLGLGGDIALAAARMISDVDDVTVIGGSASWAALLPGFETLTGRPDTRAQVFRQILEPMAHAGDYANMRIHFVRFHDDDRCDANDRFKSLVLNHAQGGGGQIVTTTLRSARAMDLHDASVWWPHVASHAA